MADDQEKDVSSLYLKIVESLREEGTTSAGKTKTNSPRGIDVNSSMEVGGVSTKASLVQQPRVEAPETGSFMKELSTAKCSPSSPVKQVVV
eukprot:Gb_16743 [translate_table: standard]